MALPDIISIPLLTPIKWVILKISCWLFRFGWYEGGMNKCLNEKGKDIVMIKELEKDIKELKEDNKVLKEDNKEIKEGNKRLEDMMMELLKGKKGKVKK